MIRPKMPKTKARNPNCLEKFDSFKRKTAKKNLPPQKICVFFDVKGKENVATNAGYHNYE